MVVRQPVLARFVSTALGHDEAAKLHGLTLIRRRVLIGILVARMLICGADGYALAVGPCFGACMSLVGYLVSARFTRDKHK
jgi:hypothetical protein